MSKTLLKILKLKEEGKAIYQEIDELTGKLLSSKKDEWFIEDKMYYIKDNFESDLIFKPVYVKRYEIKSKKAA